jgi:hypothetical protein
MIVPPALMSRSGLSISPSRCNVSVTRSSDTVLPPPSPRRRRMPPPAATSTRPSSSISARTPGTAMPTLERLFLLEVKFHRRLRTQAPGTADSSGLHTSYALQSGYDPLIRAAGTVTARAIEQTHHRHTMAGDARDILAARDSLKQLLGLSQLDT